MATLTNTVRSLLIALGVMGMAVSVVLATNLDGLLLRAPPVKEVLLALVSAGVLAVGLLMPRARPKALPRTPPQLAGELCVECRRKIVWESDGARCAICREAVHEECRVDHERLGHREAGPTAYR